MGSMEAAALLINCWSLSRRWAPIVIFPVFKPSSSKGNLCLSHKFMRLRNPGTGGDEFATNVCVVNESQEFWHGQDPK
jgi:hypothetical protein